MSVYDNSNLLVKRRRRYRAKINDYNFHLKSMPEEDEEETKQEEMNIPLDNIKRMNDERITQLEKEENERREAELFARRKLYEDNKLKTMMNKANLEAKRQAEKLLALEISRLKAEEKQRKKLEQESYMKQTVEETIKLNKEIAIRKIEDELKLKEMKEKALLIIMKQEKEREPQEKLRKITEMKHKKNTLLEAKHQKETKLFSILKEQEALRIEKLQTEMVKKMLEDEIRKKREEKERKRVEDFESNVKAKEALRQKVENEIKELEKNIRQAEEESKFNETKLKELETMYKTMEKEKEKKRLEEEELEKKRFEERKERVFKQALLEAERIAIENYIKDVEENRRSHDHRNEDERQRERVEWRSKLVESLDKIKKEHDDELKQKSIQEMKKRVEAAVKAKADERNRMRNAEIAQHQEYAQLVNQKLFISNSFVLRNSKKSEANRVNQYY